MAQNRPRKRVHASAGRLQGAAAVLAGHMVYQPLVWRPSCSCFPRVLDIKAKPASMGVAGTTQVCSRQRQPGVLCTLRGCWGTGTGLAAGRLKQEAWGLTCVERGNEALAACRKADGGSGLGDGQRVMRGT